MVYDSNDDMDEENHDDDDVARSCVSSIRVNARLLQGLHRAQRAINLLTVPTPMCG